jgi:diguanylate cyclase (GGDEF)-like protein
MSTPIDAAVASMYADALAKRAAGDLTEAHAVLVAAARLSTTQASRLWLRLRAAYLGAYMVGEMAPIDQLEAIAEEAGAADHLAVEADARATLASIYSETDVPAAFASMARAISVAARAPDSPDLALTLINIGVCCGNLGLRATGRAHFERGMRLNADPQHGEFLLVSMGSVIAADALERIGSDPDRDPLLRKAVAVSSQPIQNREVLGELIAEALTRRTRAVCLIELGQYDEAAADLIEIERIVDEVGTDPTYGDRWYIDAALRWRCGDEHTALELLDRARPEMSEGRGLPLLVTIVRLKAEIMARLGDVTGSLALLHSLAEYQSSQTRLERELRDRFLGVAVELIGAQALSMQDPLTGLPNRRALQRDLELLLDRDGTILVAAVDLDHFKQINDEIGYQFGDDVIQRLADLLRRSQRRDDVIARLGGDEFIVAMPCADQQSGEARLNAIRESVARTIWGPAHPHLQLTASIGAVFGEARDRPMAELWIADASAALRSAKVTGRNNVSVF